MQTKGFTLIELMIAISIVGILAAIAYPAYQKFFYKIQRADGHAALMNLAAYMEHYYTENNTYENATLAGLGLTANSQQQFYKVAITHQTATSYLLTATPIGPQNGDSACPTLTLDNTNTKGPHLACWQ